MEQSAKYPKYMTSKDLKWKGVVKSVYKSGNKLQPIFEAITNALESIEIRKQSGAVFTPYIRIELHYGKTLEGQRDNLYEIVVEDNGIGFDDTNFERVQIFKDECKGFNNLGSGRIQFVHFFQTAEYESRYLNGENKVAFRNLTLSQLDRFIANNCIVCLDGEGLVNDDAEIFTRLRLKEFRDKKDKSFYNGLSVDDLKEAIISHYILYFCSHKDFPRFILEYYYNDEKVETQTIENKDAPAPSLEPVTLTLPLSQVSDDFKRVETTKDNVEVTMRSYKLPMATLSKNQVKIACKEEIVEGVKLKLPCLKADENIDSYRYLFLLTGQYFDDLTEDNRDSIEILTKKDFKKAVVSGKIDSPRVVVETIEETVSEKAESLFEEIGSQKVQYALRMEVLKRQYLLSDEALAEARADDPVEDILSKAYSYDAKIIAKKDAAYQDCLDKLKSIDTSNPHYHEEFGTLVEEMTANIPVKDRTALTRYVTHRKMALQLFLYLLNGDTEPQRSQLRNIDERRLHNLLFTQGSDDTQNSNLWFFNEEYIYFSGLSECKLKDVTIDGKPIFKDCITEAEETYLKSLGEDRTIKRPDILLFPAEHKCIIIELKTPTTNLALHLSQIPRYASFLRSYTREGIELNTFYGYLVGEALEPRDIRASDGEFRADPHFNYCYKRGVNVAHLENGTDGSLDIEVIQYSELLRRAMKRNEIFISKLFPPKEELKDGTAIAPPQAVQQDLFQQSK